MEHHRKKDKIRRTYRLTERALERIRGLKQQYGEDATQIITRAIDTLWEFPANMPTIDMEVQPTRWTVEEPRIVPPDWEV